MQNKIYAGKEENKGTDDMINIIHVLEIIMPIAIILIYLLALGWNARNLVLTKKDIYFYLRITSILVSIGFITLYTYIFVDLMGSNSLHFPTISILFSRPLVFMAGAVIASNARIKYLLLKHKNGR